jgi:hypothetical protein
MVMTINEFLKPFNLESISEFKLNGTVVSFIQLKNNKSIIKQVELEVSTKAMAKEHVQLIYDTDDPALLLEMCNIDKHLPVNSSYTFITLNILTEDV